MTGAEAAAWMLKDARRRLCGIGPQWGRDPDLVWEKDFGSLTAKVTADIDRQVQLYTPSASPLVNITTALQKAPQYKFDWIEADAKPWWRFW